MHPIHLQPIGRFGWEVCEALSTVSETEMVIEASPFRSVDWPQSRLQVVVASQEHPRAFEFIDSMSFALIRPWMPIVLEPRSLRVGPLVVPNSSGCYRCFLARQYQHGRLTSIDRELAQQNDAVEGPGYSGYLASHVSLAVALVAPTIERFLSSNETRVPAASVIRAAFAETRFSEGSFVGVDGCHRCADPRTAARSAEIFTGLVDLQTPI